MSDDIIYPRCVKGGRDPAFTVRGFFLPCCWCDNQSSMQDFEYLGFFHDDFHIDNQHTKDDIKAIFASEEWQYFYDTVQNNQKEAPNTCKYHCGIRNGKVKTMTEKMKADGTVLGREQLINLKEL